MLDHCAGLIQRLWEERLLHGGTKGMGWEAEEEEGGKGPRLSEIGMEEGA